jgi:POT family proton-dependent oligopeptide transporter
MTKSSEKTLFGHPVGLFVLFLTEMWERFSYYGMRALLILYMSKELIVHARGGSTVYGFAFIETLYPGLNTDQLASQVYGLYTFLVYCTPLAGGLIADRFLGQKKSIIIGGVLMMIGHFLMAFEPVFLVALLFLILGNGAFKPNISTQVGDLYPEGDPRRDGAFTIFYMGINLGAIFSGLVCGTLGELYGWHYGFTAAGVGMGLGLMVYLWGQKYLTDSQNKHQANLLKHEAEPLTTDQWKAIVGIIVLSFANVVFWGAFEQQGNTMQLLSTNNTDWSVGNLFTMPSTWLQVINPLCIVLFATYMMGLWDRMGQRQPSSIKKMALGAALLGVGFVFLVIPTMGFTEETQMSFLWFIPTLLIVTIGELCFSPIGLSMVTKVAPARYVGLLMGWWFFSMAGGNYFSGFLGTYYSDPTWAKSEFFSLMVILGLALGFAIFLMEKPLKKAVGHGV